MQIESHFERLSQYFQIPRRPLTWPYSVYVTNGRHTKSKTVMFIGCLLELTVRFTYEADVRPSYKLFVHGVMTLVTASWRVHVRNTRV